MTPTFAWQDDFNAGIAMLVIIISGLGGLAVAGARAWKALKRELKTNHGSTTFGDSQDRQYEKLHDILGILSVLRSDLRGVQHDLRQLDARVVGERQDTARRIAQIEAAVFTAPATRSRPFENN
ncbi:MAG: hypothetical protein LBV06_08340 [Propionibacteriaceae bacterium]|jgi:hypothetical protein|nr:hypothetical protein [Propionibacteriaceae bacterium]